MHVTRLANQFLLDLVTVIEYSDDFKDNESYKL